MDFLGFLEEKKDFPGIFNQNKTIPNRPAARDPRIPAAARVPRGLRWGEAPHWPAAADPAAAGAAGRGVATRVARVLSGGRTGSWDPFYGHSRMWALVRTALGRLSPPACEMLDENPQTAAARQRLAGGEVRRLGPLATAVRCSGIRSIPYPCVALAKDG
jgi:hypothetical protein